MPLPGLEEFLGGTNPDQSLDAFLSATGDLSGTAPPGWDAGSMASMFSGAGSPGGGPMPMGMMPGMMPMPMPGTLKHIVVQIPGVLVHASSK
jgi:hypothetical protein